MGRSKKGADYQFLDRPVGVLVDDYPPNFLIHRTATSARNSCTQRPGSSC